MAGVREYWSGRGGFILANVAAAIGLGSIWKFPYELGANGGGVFFLFYVLGLVLVVAPLMLAEMTIGRRGGSDAVHGMSRLAIAIHASAKWRAIGALGVVISCVVLSYYSVIGGWALAYAVDSAAGAVVVADLAMAQRHFDELLADPLLVAAYHGAFMLIISLIVARGVAAGIEAAVRVLMPVMIALIVVLAIYALAVGDARTTLNFLFYPDFTRFNSEVAIEALGLGFFSVGVGFATLMTYAAYAERHIDLIQASIATLLADTAVSLVAGLAVFPLLFAHGLDPAGGPGLVFVILPLSFADIPLGRVAAFAFFVSLALAAIASAISLLEMPVAYLRRALGWSRCRATTVSACLCWAGGLATVMSFGPWATWRPLAQIRGLADATLFDLIDNAASNLMLPIAGLGLALFAGWVLPLTILVEELKLSRHRAQWLAAMLRFVVPLCIIAAALQPLLRVN